MRARSPGAELRFLQRASAENWMHTPSLAYARHWLNWSGSFDRLKTKQVVSVIADRNASAISVAISENSSRSKSSNCSRAGNGTPRHRRVWAKCGQGVGAEPSSKDQKAPY